MDSNPLESPMAGTANDIVFASSFILRAGPGDLSRPYIFSGG